MKTIYNLVLKITAIILVFASGFTAGMMKVNGGFTPGFSESGSGATVVLLIAVLGGSVVFFPKIFMRK